MNFEKIEEKVIEWGKDRNLYKGSDPLSQYDKLEEEVEELLEALIKTDPEKISDAIGDCLVVLTHIALFNGVSLNYCYFHAYNEIKDRKGKLIDGIFVKE